jgi:hypothetical protein
MSNFKERLKGGIIVFPDSRRAKHAVIIECSPEVR